MSSDATRRPEGSGSPGDSFDLPSDAAGIEGLAAADRAPAGSPQPAAATVSPAGPAFGSGRVESIPIGRLALESGASLPVTVAYRHDGPGPDAPQVLVIHALTGSADAAGDWWEPVIGPGRALDTNRVGVLCANLLGGRYGTTGPTSIDPATGLPYGAAFPQPTARDQAALTWALADQLGIEGFSLVAGGSLGGMVAQEVALARPSAVGHVTVLGAPAAMGAMAIGWNHIQLELIDALGERGLAIASPRSPSASISASWMWFQPIAMAPIAAGAPRTVTWPTAEGRASATSWATIPPSEPPATSANRSIPRRSARAQVRAAWSRAVGCGKPAPYGTPVAGSIDLGPVVP